MNWYMLQAPGKLYHRINVISDILPSEWPPVQTRKGVPHPPPTHMLYRAALARALEPVKEGFKDMLHVAVGSDSRMFRAALVRLVARAAGKLSTPWAAAAATWQDRPGSRRVCMRMQLQWCSQESPNTASVCWCTTMRTTSLDKLLILGLHSACY